ncbi:MAG: transcription-repair coupling factor, partial [Novosphingobium sp.]|nr:transcription-repair coupling factor [Novosphingobium sp.]
MTDISRILGATAPLTLAAIPRGAQPLVMADLARAAHFGRRRARVVFIAASDAEMTAVAQTATFFAPDLDVIEFPAWDCLPYDRSSPAPGISARRLSALHRLQAPQGGPQLVVTTINAVLQRVPTPFRIREAVRLIRPGMAIAHENLAALLRRQGYVRTDTAVDAGEFAMRGSIVDIVPSGLGQGLRLDFFGDELESLRLFDPATQRTTGSIDEHLLLPACETLLDEETIRRFRSRYRETFGAKATEDPLYQAVSEGRRMAGMEHWLPLFEDRLVTLFDHLGQSDLVIADSAALGAAGERLADIADYCATRRQAAETAVGSYRPLDPAALYLTSPELDERLGNWPIHVADPFDKPDLANVISFGFSGARDFAPERARGDNAYEAVARHLHAIGKAGRKPLIAAYSRGSRSRICSILGEVHGPPPLEAESWQEALGLAAGGRPVALVLPLETGFANDELELVTEQDILGDRLVRRRRRRKDADAFIAELSALSPGDLV